MAVYGIIAGYSSIGWQAGRMVLPDTKPEEGGFLQQMKNASTAQENGQGDRKTDKVFCAEEENKEKREDGRKSKSDTEIVTNPDGSKVLLIKTHVGGMETLMSVELSKPSPLAGEQKELSEDCMVRAADRSVSDVCEGDTDRADV